MTIEELHREMVLAQIDGLEFHIKKCTALAELSRIMGHEGLAIIMDSARSDTEQRLEQTRALLTTGAN